jgi:predicted acyl esterase
MIPARDGVRLATDVYLPSRGGAVGGRFPATVERTVHNKETEADRRGIVSYFVSRGHAVV